MMDGHRQNPAEIGMAKIAASTGAFKVIEDKKGFPIGAEPLTTSVPLGSDAEYLKEIADEKKKEEKMKREEEEEIRKLMNEGGSGEDVDAIDKNVRPVKAVMPESAKVKEEVVEQETSTVSNIESYDRVLTEDEIREKYEKDMKELNDSIALLKPVMQETVKTVEKTAPKSTLTANDVILTSLKEERIKSASLQSTVDKLTDALLSYKNKVTIAELKSNYKIQLLIKEVMANTDEATGGKILSKYYKYISQNENTDDMLTIK
jgi:hypothetical protein